MDQQLNNSKNDFLWTLLANPANDARLYAYNLRNLVDDFPQSGILQALLANASDERNLKQASVYFNSRSLFKLVNAPASLAPVTDEKIVRLKNEHTNGYHPHENTIVAEENIIPTIEESTVVNTIASEAHIAEEPSTLAEHEQPLLTEQEHHPVVEAETVVEPLSEVHPVEEKIAEEAATIEIPQHDIIEDTETEPAATTQIADEAPVVEASTENKELADQLENKEDDISIIIPAMHAEHVEEQHEHPQENIFSEAVEEPLIVESPIVNNQFHQSEETVEDNTVEVKENTGNRYQFSELHDEADKLIMGSIASADFFTFDKALRENKEAETQQAAESFKAEQPVVLHENSAHNDVSKYNDEKMPYTFMWWLDKTRKEYAGIHQPYTTYAPASPIVKVKNTTDELQQQYFENIFHLTSVDELDKHAGPQVFEFGVKPKEQVIIERFIKEEPQIKPQSSDKLDNENKAKKSSEDRDELVTETLAAIYTDQMLYHKAIASYRKLMLKYPEKSRYFASKIEQLEKKTN